MLVVAGPVGVSEHDPGSHPERPARLVAALRASVTATLGTLLDADVRSERPTSGGPGHGAPDASRRAYEDALA
jgi:hypothetical protein